MTNAQISSQVEKFQSAEQLWFWFLYSKSMRHNVLRARITPTRRPCEILDAEALITKLYLAGKLTDEDLTTMKRFGDKRRAPHQHIWCENRAAQIWNNAMSVIEIAARQRGWIE